MVETIGVAIIARNSGKSIGACLRSLVDHVDQLVVVYAGESTDNTVDEVELFKGNYSLKLETYSFSWCDDFSAARNFSFSKLKTDWQLWVDSDDTVLKPENLRELIKEVPQEVGAIWFPYHYAQDEFGNITTIYERERLLRAKQGWVWRSRLHETVSPLQQCKYVRTDKVIIKHDHLAGTPRNDRNFKLLNIMYEEDSTDKRIWLYLGHQHFAAQHWMKSAEWYLKFGQDMGAIDLERYQALCYACKSLREMKDPQSIQIALMAIDLFPQYRDAYLELAHSYLRTGQYDKAIHFAKLSDNKELLTEPPSVIFINPLEYTFNKYALLAECYVHKNDPNTALGYAKQAYDIRPSKDVENNLKAVEQLILQNRVTDGIKVLAIHLLNNKEIVKLPHLLHAIPYWFRETPEYEELRAGIEHYTKDMESKPRITGDKKHAIVNVGNAFGLKELLDDLDKKHDSVTVIAPFPDSAEQMNVLSQSDMERLIVTSSERHIKNLHMDETRILCEYDKKQPKGMLVKFYTGQGLEHWNPKTIKEIGCGGSETAVAKVSAELSKRDHQAIVYAMDNQVWDGVLYRHHSKFNPEGNPCDLFISSRIPDLFSANIQALQKWLWVHDISCFERLTPELAEQIDVVIALSHWHAEHLKRTYPWLDSEIVDMDDQDKTYDDLWTPNVYEGECRKPPKIVIIGNGLDVERYKVKEKRIPYRFVWCSSPDRGLEELLNLWPLLKKKLPKAELKIFYGWEYFDSSLGVPSQREFKERIRVLLNQDGVEWCGRVGQEELAREMMKSDAILYPPHSFRETYGIAFLEAQAAGSICFYRKNGALGETIGERGVPIEMNATQEEIVDTVVKTLKDKLLCGKLRTEGRKYAMQRTWGKQTEKILEVYDIMNKREGS